jgi:hypothetical protein
MTRGRHAVHRFVRSTRPIVTSDVGWCDITFGGRDMILTSPVRRLAVCSAAVVSLFSAGARASNLGHSLFLGIKTGHVVVDVVGEVNNLAATPDAPLGTSQQFGYVSNLEGVDTVFTDPNPANQNESTAMLTFFTDVKTTRVTAHGPFSIVIREGTTTFFRNTAPASFSAPASFESGQPIISSTIRQQVIVDTVTKTFTVTNVNTITGSRSFELGDDLVRIGVRGDMIRTSLVGVLRVRDGVPPPTGHFAGNGVGIARDDRDWK